MIDDQFRQLENSLKHVDGTNYESTAKFLRNAKSFFADFKDAFLAASPEDRKALAERVECLKAAIEVKLREGAKKQGLNKEQEDALVEGTKRIKGATTSEMEEAKGAIFEEFHSLKAALESEKRRKEPKSLQTARKPISLKGIGRKKNRLKA